MTSATMPPKPVPLAVLAENVPDELRQREQWVAWRWEWNGRKWTKPPYSLQTGRHADKTDAAQWSSFDEVIAAVRRGDYDGIGFCFAPDDPFTGIDLDDCRNPETGDFDPWAELAIEIAGSYTEVSPSGRGAKIILQGKKPAGRSVDHKRGIEIYDRGSYFCITGHGVPGTPAVIRDRQQQLEYLHALHLSSKDQRHEQNGYAADDRELALQALDALKPARAEGYLDWLSVGMALHAVDPSETMLAAWDRWSQSCGEKYAAGECGRKWRSFGGTGVGIGSLIHWAKEDGWIPPRHTRTSDGNGAPQSYKLTDLGNAERFADGHGRDVRYCHPWKTWLHWDGRRWIVDETGAAVRLAKATVRRIWNELPHVEDEEKRKKLAQHAASSESSKRINAMLALAASEPGIPVLPDELDRDPWLLNVANGTIDLRTGELRPHRREDLLTKICPTRYNPDAASYHWDRLLEAVLEAQAMIDFIQRLFGYALTGDQREQLLAILWGSGSNGKSTLLNAFMHALGPDYSMQAASELLMAKRNDSHPTERADLFGRRFVAAVESEDGRRLAEALVKQITGGERIRARWVHKDFFEFDPTHTVVLCTNHKPEVRGSDQAIWRRIALVPFTQKFWDPSKGQSGPPERRADKTIKDKLEAEAEGILAWAVRGCRDWQRHGLQIPPEVQAATSSYKAEQDILEQFIADRCVVAAGQTVRASEIYRAYRAWADAGGEKTILSQRKFGRQMTAKGYERGTNNGVWYQGINLTPQEQEGNFGW